MGLVLDLRRSFPSSYPLRLGLEVAIAREQPLARALDYGVITPRLPELYEFSATCLGEPRRPGLLDDGAPAYAWPRADRDVWSAGRPGRCLRMLARLTGAREGYDPQSP